MGVLDEEKQRLGWALAVVLPLGISGLASIALGVFLSDWELIFFGAWAFGLFLWIVGVVGPIRRRTTAHLSPSQVIALSLAIAVGAFTIRLAATGRFNAI